MALAKVLDGFDSLYEVTTTLEPPFCKTVAATDPEPLCLIVVENVGGALRTGTVASVAVTSSSSTSSTSFSSPSFSSLLSSAMVTMETDNRAKRRARYLTQSCKRENPIVTSIFGIFDHAYIRIIHIQ